MALFMDKKIVSKRMGRLQESKWIPKKKMRVHEEIKNRKEVSQKLINLDSVKCKHWIGNHNWLKTLSFEEFLYVDGH